MSRLAIITFITRDGVDIDNTLPGAPVYPSHGLPGGGYPSGGPVFPGGPVDPGYGRPGWSPADPGYGRPGFAPGHPGNALPGGDHIWWLPVFPFDPTRPDHELPGAPGRPGHDLPNAPGHPDHDLPNGPGHPDHTLPGGGASTKPIRPGARFVVKWLACQGLILVPDNTLPETPTPEPK